MVYLDTLSPLSAQVGYGRLGLGGDLGYEGKRVQVGQGRYPHALSTHPPARLMFELRGRFSHFRCAVALNDDVPPGRSHASFTVTADGRPVATATYVRAGEVPHPLTAAVAGAQVLELAVQTGRWEFCHAVWLDPELDEAPAEVEIPLLHDCLGRATIPLPAARLHAERCIATVVSPGFETLLDDMLGSLYANSGCPDALVVVFALDPDPSCARVVAKYGAQLIPCRSRAGVNAMSKAVLYSVAHVVEARQYLCLDADMLVLGDLRPLFAALEACPEGSILASREGNGKGLRNLSHALGQVYGGSDGDLRRLLGSSDGEGAYGLVVNDGLFAGSRAALLALDGAIRAMPEAARWVDERRDIWWRNQFVFNLALARLDCGIELDGAYNVQLHVQDVILRDHGGQIRAEWRGRPARVLHFSGSGRHKYPEWRGLFARVPDPLVSPGGKDSRASVAYEAFLAALRGWLGRRGLSTLAWSFYGTSDGRSAQVADAGTLPLLALLHYLVRANGCVHVIETGTGRGVSAACLASAVAHRPGGRVVTLDVSTFPERQALWAALPGAMQAAIEPRAVDAVAGLRAALAAGERYDAALLDSLHTAEQVWAEFELVRKLVCPGGLILIHDVRYPHGTVEVACRRIEAAGYGVTRLWTAEGSVPEDNGLGLAVIENSRRPSPGDGLAH